MPKNTHGYRICHRNMININLYPLIDITLKLIFGQIFHKEAWNQKCKIMISKNNHPWQILFKS